MRHLYFKRVLVIFGLLALNAVLPLQAATSRLFHVTLRYSDSSVPQNIGFEASVVGRPSEVINMGSAGSVYDDGTGLLTFDLSGFATQWTGQDTLAVSFFDGGSKNGALELRLTSEEVADTAVVTLSATDNISLSLGDESVVRGDEVELPVLIDGIVPADSVIAYELTLGFDESLLQALGATSQGTMTENWGEPLVAPRTGEVVVGGFTTNQTGSQLQEDSRVLVKVNCQVLGTPENTDLDFAYIHFKKATIHTLDSTYYLSRTRSGLVIISGIYARSGGPYSGVEGQPVQFDGSGSAGATEYIWNFGDGQTGSGVTPTHTYGDNGEYTVQLIVQNDQGMTSLTSETVASIENAPPVIEVGADITADEGEAIAFPLSLDDPGWLDTHEVIWDFGDGSRDTTQTAVHAYGQNGSYSVHVTAIDDDGGQNEDNLTVKVNNVAPTAHTGGPYQAVINGPLQLQGSVTDPGTDDTHTFAWDLDNDGIFNDYDGQYPTVTYSVMGVYTVGLRVRDSDGASDVKTTTITVGQGVAVEIKTDPENENLNILVNGNIYQMPHVFYFSPGSEIVLEAPQDQQVDDQTRYHFSKWADGGERVKTITVPNQPVVYTAEYNLQYYVDIQTGSVEAATSGEGWYLPGESVDISVSANVMGVEYESRFAFAGWTGTGDGSYSGAQRNATVTVSGPIVQAVQWTQEYYLQTATAYGSVSGEGWYAEGERVSIEATINTANDAKTRYAFVQWAGQGNGAYSGSDNPATVVMNGPISQTAEWTTQHKLEIITDYHTPVGGGWYTAGTDVFVSMDTTMVSDAGQRARFVRWAGVGVGSYQGSAPAYTVTMDGPVTQTAQWQIQYKLTIESQFGTPQGEGWYDANELVDISVAAFFNVDSGSRYRFEGWRGQGTGSYTGTAPDAQVIMSEPVTQSADWKLQYYVTTAVTPSGGGTLPELPVPGGWVNAHSTLTLSAQGDRIGQYGFTQWSGDATGSENPLQLFVDSPKNVTAQFEQGSIRIDTNPPGLRIIVDGHATVAPFAANWLEGESHAIGVIDPQGDDVKKRYSFTQWNDGGSAAHDIIVGSTITQYMAFFNASYHVEVSSETGTPVGTGWYLHGGSAQISVDEVVQDSEWIRRRFAGWTGEGEGSYTGTEREISLNVYNPVTETARWTYEFKLNAAVQPSGFTTAQITANPPGPWYEPGTAVQLTVNANIPGAVFTGWSGDASGSGTTTTITIDGPTSVQANFNVTNEPPMIQAMPKFYLVEDVPYVRPLSWLEQYVKDENDNIENLSYVFDAGGKVTGSVDAQARTLTLLSGENWSGVTQVKLKVTDPQGFIAEGTVEIEVLPVDDLPGEFSLLSPVDQGSFEDWSWTTEFSWQAAANVDEGDTITYNFYFSPNADLTGEGTIAVTNLADTTLLLGMQTPGTYYWAVWAQDRERQKTRCREVFSIELLTSVEEVAAEQPKRFSLDQNYPNPFNPETRVGFDVAKAGHLTLTVYDMLGRRTVVIHDAMTLPGRYEAVWNGCDGQGNACASGLYILRLVCGDFVAQRKMLLIR